MKLTRGKLLETIRRKNEGWTTYQTRKIGGVSVRRVNQVMRAYERLGEAPVIGRRNGRPPKPLTEEELILVHEAWLRYRVSATTLTKLIERDYSVQIGHNRVHRLLMALGFAQHARKARTKKRGVRYERRHSLTAVHVDWHIDRHGRWIYAVEDDASRKLLALIEGGRATTDASIAGVEEVLRQGPIRQLISDNGTQFTKRLLDGNCRFEAYLEAKGIKHIKTRIKHPQSNGKIEKWFHTYDKHRDAFETKEEFLVWYNEIRPHRSLRFDKLETPAEAFERKKRAEV
jgi:putative transposase